MIGLELLLRGEFLGRNRRGAKLVRLIIYPGYGKVASGDHRPHTWRYELKLAQPGDDVEPLTRNIAANGVVHVRDGADVLAPWKGYSRLQRMGVTSQALADIEGPPRARCADQGNAHNPSARRNTGAACGRTWATSYGPEQAGT